MRCDRCGAMSFVKFSACGYSLCPKCAKLLYTLLESKQLVGSLAIASMPLGERTRLHRERAEKYARQEVA